MRKPSRRRAGLFDAYVWGRQSAEQLGAAVGKSSRWVREQLDVAVSAPKPLTPQETIAVVDTTFWGREYGVCVFRPPVLKENLWWKETGQETAAVYAEGRACLEKEGWTLRGVVIDGRHGLIKAFSGIPVQICHFHQIKNAWLLAGRF